MLKSTAWFILLSFFSTLCYAQYKNQIILQKKTNPLYFYYIDYYNNIKSQREFTNEGRVQSDGTITIETQFPLIVTFTKNQDRYPVYLKPGDTCSISSDDHASLSYMFKGTLEQGELNFLTLLEKKTGFTFPDLDLELTPKLNIIAYVEMLRELRDRRMSILQHYCDSLKLSSVFRTEIKNIIYYKFLTGTLKPFFYPVPGYNYATLPIKYLEEINTYKKHVNDSMSTKLHYRLFILNYNKYLTKQYLQSSAPYTFENLFASACNNFSGKSRDYLMFLLLKENASKALPNFSQHVAHFKKECADEKFVHYIDSVWQKESKKLPAEFAATPIESVRDSTLTWQSILDKSKGKVIYIDFWASWCGPCIQEMPNAELLHDKVNKEKISFVYVSIDRTGDAWRKGIDKLPGGVQKSEHYRLDASTNLGKYFDLTSIPRYVIIDKEGNIAAFNAGRPGSDDTRVALERLSAQ